MSGNVKKVKVKEDNWGVYFLQRLKHFFNRTDYCDLTLQFQDNAQLKVHRLVLSACTEYFELLERTCEMYEDCLVMPDDLQADVVVRIVNFMYTGQLEFTMDLLENLYQTSQIMNMPVLTKLLEAHRPTTRLQMLMSKYQHAKRVYSKGSSEVRPKPTRQIPSSSTSAVTYKRSFQKAFSLPVVPSFIENEKKPATKIDESFTSTFRITNKKGVTYNPRPTRYEFPEIDGDNIFDDSFTNITYTSHPLITHPDAAKHFRPKKSKLFSDASSSKSFSGATTIDIVECKKKNGNDNLFQDEENNQPSEEKMHLLPAHLNVKPKTKKMTSQLFNQILDQGDGPKVTIETKDSKQASNIDHAKIISEVLKKYPHLVKSNKNIKLKIVDFPSKSQSQSPTLPKRQQNKHQQKNSISQYDCKIKEEVPDFNYETDVLDSKEAARLIAMGAENIKGPWICLICGAPGKALNFTSYYKFRRHLVEVHNEKPISQICEYCGRKSPKRNFLLHHIYSKHGVPPPPPYSFPKCNQCNYIALTEGFLVKHKLRHSEPEPRKFRCNVCSAWFTSSKLLLSHIQSTGHKYSADRIIKEKINFKCNVCSACFDSSTLLLSHIQSTGHKYSADRKINLQCIYCLKVFLREANLYAHLKTAHKQLAIHDGMIEESDEDDVKTNLQKQTFIKYEPFTYKQEEDEEEDSQYQIQQKADGNIQLLPNAKKHLGSTPIKQKILNTGLGTTVTKPDSTLKTSKVEGNEYAHEINVNNSPNKISYEETVVIDNEEYIIKDNQLIPKRSTISDNEYVISTHTHNIIPPSDTIVQPTLTMEYSEMQTAISQKRVTDQKRNQPIQIVVSNEEEYKSLMNSNHSIIFDDGDTNKTLTVLSTPHTTAMNTSAIDLDNTQTSDMMIIQDPNYPLTVSESIQGDNSNIVVVYSHAVDNENKQYQLLASQDLGAQFGHTSAVITPNYGMATQHVPVSWHTTNIIQNDQPQISSTELQHMAIENKEDSSNITERLCDLPDVTMTAHISDHTNQLQKSSEHFAQSDNINQEMVNMISENIKNEPADPMDTQEEILQNNNTLKFTSEISNKDEAMSASEIEINTSGANFKIMENKSSPMEQSNGRNIEGTFKTCIVQQCTEEHTEEASSDAQNLVMAEETELIVHENEQSVILQETDNNDQEIPLNSSESTHKLLDEQIKTLESQWSEDRDNATNLKQHNEPTTSVETENNKSPKELEESIENIQHGMNRQKSEMLQSTAQAESNLPVCDVQEISEEAVTTKPEKISLLLNDWEDNKSRSDNELANIEIEESIENRRVKSVIKENESLAIEKELCKEQEIQNTQIEKLPQKEDNKIKNLVSDWDEEEEDKS